MLGGWLYKYSTETKTGPIVYTIARDQSWYPLQLYGKSGNISGFSDDLFRAIAKEKNFQFNFALAGPDVLFEGLNQGYYDAVLSEQFPYNAGIQYITSDPYYLLGPVLVVSVTSTIRTLKDVNGKIIGVFTDAPTLLDLNQFPNVNFQSYIYSSLPQPLDDLVNGVIDGMVLDFLQAYEYTQGSYAGRLKIATLPLTNDGLRLIAVDNLQSQKLVNRFNSGLKAIRKNGTYDALLQKWSLVNPASTEVLP